MATLKEIFEGNTDQIIEATELLKVLADREGLYVWEKSKDVTVHFEQLTTGSGNPLQLKCTSDDVDLTTVDGSFFWGMKGTRTVTTSGNVYEYEFLADNKFISGTSGTERTYTYDPTTTTIALTEGSLASICTWTDGEKTLVEYVVADDENAYPNGGEQDGYWYEPYRKYGNNVWEKSIHIPSEMKITETEVSNVVTTSGTGRDTPITFYYADSYTYANGTYTLVSAKNLNSSPNGFSSNSATLKGKYFTKNHKTSDTEIYKYTDSSSGTYEYKNSSYYIKVNKPLKVEHVITPEVHDVQCYIVDDNQYAYPDENYDSDGYYYVLLAHIESTNIMRLSNGAYEQVEAGVIDEIVEGVNK